MPTPTQRQQCGGEPGAHFFYFVVGMSWTILAGSGFERPQHAYTQGQQRGGAPGVNFFSIVVGMS
jgi:hypothetical protein